MSDDELKEHREELEAAINYALSESPEIKDSIRAIRKQGFDVFLIVEATIGFTRRQGEAGSGDLDSHLDLTDKDVRFLRSLKIRPE